MWRTAFVTGVIAAMLPLGVAHAQLPGIEQEVLARGAIEYAAAVEGPADVYMGTIRMEAGSRYGRWHVHPGPVWVVVTAGELAVYGPDRCRTTYGVGSAYLAEPDTLYDLFNETEDVVALVFTGVIRSGDPPTIFIDGPGTTCPE